MRQVAAPKIKNTLKVKVPNDTKDEKVKVKVGKEIVEMGDNGISLLLSRFLTI